MLWMNLNCSEIVIVHFPPLTSSPPPSQHYIIQYLIEEERNALNIPMRLQAKKRKQLEESEQEGSGSGTGSEGEVERKPKAPRRAFQCIFCQRTYDQKFNLTRHLREQMAQDLSKFETGRVAKIVHPGAEVEQWIKDNIDDRYIGTTKKAVLQWKENRENIISQALCSMQPRPYPYLSYIYIYMHIYFKIYECKFPLTNTRELVADLWNSGDLTKEEAKQLLAPEDAETYLAKEAPTPKEPEEADETVDDEDGKKELEQYYQEHGEKWMSSMVDVYSSGLEVLEDVQVDDATLLTWVSSDTFYILVVYVERRIGKMVGEGA